MTGTEGRGGMEEEKLKEAGASEKTERKSCENSVEKSSCKFLRKSFESETDDADIILN